MAIESPREIAERALERLASQEGSPVRPLLHAVQALISTMSSQQPESSWREDLESYQRDKEDFDDGIHLDVRLN